MADKQYVVMTVECTRCREKQKVHVAVSTDAGAMVNERVECLTCGEYMKVALPDRIVRGPFPA